MAGLLRSESLFTRRHKRLVHEIVFKDFPRQGCFRHSHGTDLDTTGLVNPCDALVGQVEVVKLMWPVSSVVRQHRIWVEILAKVGVLIP